MYDIMVFLRTKTGYVVLCRAVCHLEEASTLGVKASQHHCCVSRSRLSQALGVRQDGLPRPTVETPAEAIQLWAAQA